MLDFMFDCDSVFSNVDLSKCFSINGLVKKCSSTEVSDVLLQRHRR